MAKSLGLSFWPGSPFRVCPREPISAPIQGIPYKIGDVVARFHDIFA